MSRITLMDKFGMWLRRVPVRLIVQLTDRMAAMGLPDQHVTLQAHFFAGGNIELVVSTMEEFARAGRPLEFNRIAVHDLAGHDLEKLRRLWLAGDIDEAALSRAMFLDHASGDRSDLPGEFRANVPK